jgi:hypothetical protein
MNENNFENLVNFDDGCWHDLHFFARGTEPAAAMGIGCTLTPANKKKRFQQKDEFFVVFRCFQPNILRSPLKYKNN